MHMYFRISVCPKIRHHDISRDILIIMAVHAVYAGILQGTTDYVTHELDTQIALGFLPLLAVSVYTLGRALRLPVRFVTKRMPNTKLIHLG